MRIRATSISAVVAVTMLAGACGGKGKETPTGPSGGGSGGNTVTISIPSSDGYGSSSFSPGSVTVDPGTVVVWANRDTVAHTSTADNNVWNSVIGAGSEFSRTFSTSGAFNYRCTLHAGMSGTITVR